MNSEWFDNATWKGEILEAILQTSFWMVALTMIGDVMDKQFSSRPWFDKMKKHKGGTHEFITGARVMFHHITAGSLAVLGYLTGNPWLIRHATLTEFGYEAFDLCRQWYLYFADLLPPEDAIKNVIAWTLHHLPGILVIIPANLTQVDDVLFQKIVVLLLAPSSFNVFCISLAKTYDVAKLGERTKFTVVYILS